MVTTSPTFQYRRDNVFPSLRSDLTLQITDEDARKWESTHVTVAHMENTLMAT